MLTDMFKIFLGLWLVPLCTVCITFPDEELDMDHGLLRLVEIVPLLVPILKN
jgi:hypothetical protein